MNRENINNIRPTPIQAFQEIKALEQQVLQGGNVDSEREAFAKIYNELSTHHMTEEEALVAAHSLVNSRQQYH